MTPLTDIVASVLDVAPDEVSDDLGPTTHAKWTSIKHLQLIVALEEAYSVSFTREEIRSVRSLADVRRELKDKGVEL